MVFGNVFPQCTGVQRLDNAVFLKQPFNFIQRQQVNGQAFAAVKMLFAVEQFNIFGNEIISPVGIGPGSFYQLL